VTTHSASNGASHGLPPSPVHWAAVEDWAEEGPLTAAARERALADGSLQPPTRAQCAALGLFANVIGAEHILMLGSTAGVGEAWLLAGMDPGGTLTVIDADPHRQALTRDALTTSPSGSARVITAQATEVLPRLADSGYDLIVLDEATAISGDAQHAPRLLRPGGVLAIRLADHEGSRSLRDVAASLREDPRWATAWLTVGDGVLVSVWHGAGDDVAASDSTASDLLG
jgi:predicted O-methyltransferase YrrM